jgi:hypothetical protein
MDFGPFITALATKASISDLVLLLIVGVLIYLLREERQARREDATAMTAGNYAGNVIYQTNAGAVTAGGSTSDTGWSLNGASNGANRFFDFSMTLFKLSNASRHKGCEARISNVTTGGALFTGTFGGIYKNTTAVNALRVSVSSGNIATGNFRLYGVR